MALGVGLVAYGLGLAAVVVGRRRWLVPVGRLAVVADTAWVVGAAATIATGLLSPTGAAVLAIVTAVVALVAAIQIIGLTDR